MTNKIVEELMAICSAKHILGAALTPRHQGLKERANLTMMVQMQVLVESVCSVFPQEWPELLPAVEYLLHTAPQGPHGLSAHDLPCAHAIASETDKRLVPFLIPSGLQRLTWRSRCSRGSVSYTELHRGACKRIPSAGRWR